MSSALETLLEAARFIELQEQREQRLTSTSSSSSLSTSPYSNSRYPSSSQCGQQLIASPPTSPVTSTDGIHNRHHLLQNNDFGGSAIIRTGKFDHHQHHHHRKWFTSFFFLILVLLNRSPFPLLLLLLYEFSRTEGLCTKPVDILLVFRSFVSNIIVIIINRNASGVPRVSRS